MQHLFEFIVVKKQTEKEVELKEEPVVMNLMYKTESNRVSKVRDLIQKELDSKGIMKKNDIKEFYLRRLK